MEALITLAIPTDQPCRRSPLLAKEGDYNIRHYAVKFMQGGKQLEISDSAIVTINVKREDGEAKAFEGTVEDNKAICPLPAFATEVGDSTVELSVSVYDDGKITTATFPVYIQAAEYSNDDVSEDESTDILTALIVTVTTLENDISTAELKRVAAENARVLAESERAAEYAALVEKINTAAEGIDEVLAAEETAKELYSQLNAVLYVDDDGDLHLLTDITV